MTLETPAPLLERFHGVLVEELRRRRPDDLGAPFTVAEIYQHLVPYSTHRDRLGLEINGDYEDILLRLLAGEGDYLVIESDAARERLRRELDSANPDTTVYREFAAVDVRITPARLAMVETRAFEERKPAGAEHQPAAGVATADAPRPKPTAPEPAAAAPSAPEPPAPEPTPSAPSASRPATEAPAEENTCSWCRAELPVRENLSYCPWCGGDVGAVPCPSCGEALEPGWRFCVACGAEVSAD